MSYSACNSNAIAPLYRLVRLDKTLKVSIERPWKKSHYRGILFGA